MTKFTWKFHYMVTSLHWMVHYNDTHLHNTQSVHGDLCDMVFINAFNINNNYGKTKCFLDFFCNNV